MSSLEELKTQNDQDFIDSCQEDLSYLEDIRVIKFKSYKRRKKLAIPAAGIITPITGFIDIWLLRLQTGDDQIAGLTGIVLFGLWWWVTQPKRQYVEAYKRRILPKIASLLGDLTYSLKMKIDMASMELSKIVPKHGTYKSEDYFEGTYKNVGLEISEIHLKKKKGSGKNRRNVTVFKGLAILLDLQHKRFHGHTLLDRNQSKITEWFKEKGTGLKRANLVDPEFEKIFDVYTNDQVEARYLIDPQMIERIKAMYDEYDGKRMATAWYHNKMLIMIASEHNYFEPADIHIPATNPQSLLSMKRELQNILSIIDHLELYDPKVQSQ